MKNRHLLNSNFSQYIGKIFWAFAPLLWGGITWFLAYGPGAYFPLSFAMRMLIGLAILIAYFYKPLEYAYRHNRVLFFEYPVPLLNWRIPISTAIGLLIIYSIYSFFFSWDFSPLFGSIVFGVFASACLEELLTRSFFIKYRMSGIEFIVFNIISSIAFTLMHAGFFNPPPSLYALFFEKGHLPFSFLLGIVAYKTQRIEITLLLHIASNFFRYTLPTFILQQQHPTIFLVFVCIEILILGGVHKAENYNKRKT